MDFSGISNQQLLGKLIRFPLRFIPATMRVPILQGPLRGKRWIVGAGTHGCWLGSYEYEKQHLFERMIQDGSTVFDIGANVGFYTLLASYLVGPTGQVIAFEPVPRNVLYLKDHLRLNRIRNVTLIEAAVSDSSGTCCFNTASCRSEGYISEQGALRVRMVMLDELLSQGQIPIPDYIKIDVEGAEMLVLSGAESLLRATHPTIFLATHGNDVREQCCDFLRTIGYTLRGMGQENVHQCDEIIAILQN